MDIVLEFIDIYNLTGIIIGAATFLTIGLFHPIVIKTEYYFGVRVWWVFLIMGLVSIVLSLCVANILLSTLLAVWAHHPYGPSKSCLTSGNESGRDGFLKGKSV